MSEQRLEQFRQLVLEEVSLQEKLIKAPDLEAFLGLVVRLGEERGYIFAVDDVEAALHASRRAWLERWIQV